jgi:peroxiredoxin
VSIASESTFIFSSIVNLCVSPKTSDQYEETDSDTEQSPLDPGTEAPDFELPTTPDQSVTLSDFRGEPVILAFYPADWSPVCGDQLGVYNELISQFNAYGAQLIGISVDGVWCHDAFAEDRNFHFPLLSDFEPKGEVAQTYGVYRDEEGTAARALFVIDEEGVIRWNHVSPVGVNPGADGIFQALDDLGSADEEAAAA